MFDISGIKQNLNQDNRILAAYLLGSAAHGQLRPDSDIDIAILSVSSAVFSPLDLADLATELTLVAGRSVDLGVVSSQNLIYASEAILTGRRFLCRNVFQTDLRAATLLGLAAQFKFERQEIINGYTL